MRQHKVLNWGHNRMDTERGRSSASVDRLLDDARRRLVETGTRNLLIHVNRATTRANSLNIVNERTSDVFDLLRVNGKRMRFLATARNEQARSTPKSR